MKLSIKGFTLIESCIALAIVGVIAFSAVKILSNRETSQDTKKVLAAQKKTSLLSVLQSDLNSALRINGSSGLTWPGLMRSDADGNFTTERLTPTESDSVSFFVAKHSNFQLPLERLTYVPATSLLFIDVVPAFSTTEEYNQVRYIFRKLELGSFAFLTNRDRINLFTTAPFVTTNFHTPSHSLTLQTPSFLTPEYQAATQLGIADKVVWTLIDGKLVRKIFRLPGVEVGRQVMAEGVESFQMDYSFSKRPWETTLAVFPKSTQKLSHIVDRRYIADGIAKVVPGGGFVTGECIPAVDIDCCNPILQQCVEWSDLTSVYVRIKFADANGDLAETFKSELKFPPANFSVEVDTVPPVGAGTPPVRGKIIAFGFRPTSVGVALAEVGLSAEPLTVPNEPIFSYQPPILSAN